MDTKKLRQKILDLAIHGKLVPQDPNDEPASVLLERIRAEKERLIKEGKIKKPKKSATSDTPRYENPPFAVPQGWEWAAGCEIFTPMSSVKPSGDTFLYADIDAIDNKSNTISPKLTSTTAAPSRASRCTQLGDTLFSMVRPYLRNIAKINTENCIASTGFYVCHPYQGINKDYIFYLMQSDYVVDGLNGFMKGDNSPSINTAHVENWLFPIPPSGEQFRIALEIERILDLVSCIEGNRLNIGLSIKQAKAKILDLAIRGKLVPQDPNDEPASELLRRHGISSDSRPYGNVPFELPDSWCWISLGSITNYGSCVTIDVNTLSDKEWVLELEDIEKDTGLIINKFSRCKREIKGVRHKFTQGNVLYSKLRTYLNKVLVAPTDGYCTTEIIPIQPAKCLLADYLAHVLRSRYFLDYTAQCVYGVKMPRLSTTDAQKGLIPIITVR